MNYAITLLREHARKLKGKEDPRVKECLYEVEQAVEFLTTIVTQKTAEFEVFDVHEALDACIVKEQRRKEYRRLR